MIKLYEFPTMYANICDTVEDIESDKLIKYNDNYCKYGSYYIKTSELTNIKKRGKRNDKQTVSNTY